MNTNFILLASDARYYQGQRESAAEVRNAMEREIRRGKRESRPYVRAFIAEEGLPLVELDLDTLEPKPVLGTFGREALVALADYVACHGNVCADARRVALALLGIFGAEPSTGDPETRVARLTEVVDRATYRVKS